MARRKVTFASEVRKIGTGYFIPFGKKEMDKMGLHEGDDIDVVVSYPEGSDA